MAGIVAESVAAIKGSGIRDIMEAVWRMPGPVIGLHVGEPNFPTPPHVVDAMRDALARGETRYVPNAGLPQLREALAHKVSSVNGFPAAPDNVVVSAGGMQALFAALAITVRPGDEVLMPDPGWPNYDMAIRLLSGIPVRYPISADAGSQVDFAALDSLLTDRTRAIIVNSPSNPVGVVFTPDTLRGLVDFVDRHNLVAVSDECYESITFEQAHHSMAEWDRHGRVMTCFSFSKTYAMTGVRVGYLVAQRDAAAVAARMQESLLSCVNAAAQFGALAAVTGPQDEVATMVAAYRHRRDQATMLLASSGIRFVRPQGAFYLWFHIGEGSGSSLDWSLRLLREQRVAVAPGTTFGAEGRRWARVSLATDLPDLLEGLGRIASVIG